jgi:hypothetical protein
MYRLFLFVNMQLKAGYYFKSNIFTNIFTLFRHLLSVRM